MLHVKTPEEVLALIESEFGSVAEGETVSLAEAMAYQEMGETEAAQISLQYYAGYVKKTYLEAPGFVERLDMIDPSPENYWSKTLPDIERRIQALPCNAAPLQIGACEDGTESL